MPSLRPVARTEQILVYLFRVIARQLGLPNDDRFNLRYETPYRHWILGKYGQNIRINVHFIEYNVEQKPFFSNIIVRDSYSEPEHFLFDNFNLIVCNIASGNEILSFDYLIPNKNVNVCLYAFICNQYKMTFNRLF